MHSVYRIQKSFFKDNSCLYNTEHHTTTAFCILQLFLAWLDLQNVDNLIQKTAKLIEQNSTEDRKIKASNVLDITNIILLL